MIKLLSLLGGISLAASGAASLIQIKTEDATKSKKFYWNDDHSEVTQLIMSQAAGPETNSPTFSGKILTLDVGTRKSTEASYRMPFSDGFVTWGDDTYFYGFNQTAFPIEIW